MNSRKRYYLLVIMVLVGVSVFTCFALLQKSSFLARPMAGHYAILVTISKDAPKDRVNGFSEKARDFPGSSYEEPSSIKSENSDYVFLRINRSNNQNPDVHDAISIIENLIMELDLNAYVEYAVLSDEGTLKASGSFDPRLFP